MSFKLPQTSWAGAVALSALLWATTSGAQPAAAPRAPAPPAPSPAPSPAAPGKPAEVDAGRAGTATVLKAGRPVGLGLVLAADGRVLVSRTSLGGAKKNLALRFADDSQVVAEVGHEDPATDLALLVPAKATFGRGLVPSAVLPAEGARLDAFELRNNRPERRPISTKSPAGAGGALVDASGPQVLGTPAIDASGQAVGVVVSACDPGEGKACKPKTRLATVPVLRTFLRALPPTAAIPQPYLGARTERAIGTYARGVRVVEIAPGSPAAQAKLSAGPDGDLLLALAGEPVTSPEELARALRKHAVGEKVTLLVLTKAGYRQADVQLTRDPAAITAAPPPAPPGGRPATSPSDGAPKDFGGPR